jgi:FkbM family methyltransferase
VIATLRRIHGTLGLKYRIDRMLGWARRFGIRRAFTEHRRMTAAQGAPIELSVPGVAHLIALRAGTADMSTFEHVFVWNDYELAYPPVVRTVIDAGANIGLASVFFANRFPGARIIAIEPEAANFALLERNVAPYPNIVPLRAALWSEDTLVGLSNPGVGVDSYRFDAVSALQKVEALSIPSLIDRFGMQRVDLLKVDIEGGETAIFKKSPEWVRQVGMFVIELHGTDAEMAFTSATSCLVARRWRRGENHVVAMDGATEAGGHE